MPRKDRPAPEGRYHFPVIFLVPQFEDTSIGTPDAGLYRRLWDTSMFDVATLGAEHDVKFPYVLMDVFLARCSLELAVAAEDLDGAREKAFAFRALLYAEGAPPFLMPYCTNVSVNAYSGINARDSPTRRRDLPPGLRDGVTTESCLVRAVAIELSLASHTLPNAPALRRDQVERALAHLDGWMALCKREPALRFFQGAITSAAQLISTPQAILHLWTGIEGLFPSVQSEVSFRLALNVACLEPDRQQRRAVFETVKKAYGVRSRIAHGAHKGIGAEEWEQTWRLAVSILRSLLALQRLPSEQELMDQVLGASGL